MGLGIDVKWVYAISIIFSSIFKIQQIHELMGGQMQDKTVDKLLHKYAMYQLEWDLKNKFLTLEDPKYLHVFPKKITKKYSYRSDLPEYIIL